MNNQTKQHGHLESLISTAYAPDVPTDLGEDEQVRLQTALGAVTAPEGELRKNIGQRIDNITERRKNAKRIENMLALLGADARVLDHGIFKGHCAGSMPTLVAMPIEDEEVRISPNENTMPYVNCTGIQRVLGAWMDDGWALSLFILIPTLISFLVFRDVCKIDWKINILLGIVVFCVCLVAHVFIRENIVKKTLVIKFSGTIPDDVREKIFRCKRHFEKVFLLTNAPEWYIPKKLEYLIPTDDNVLVIGFDGTDYGIIDEFTVIGLGECVDNILIKGSVEDKKVQLKEIGVNNFFYFPDCPEQLYMFLGCPRKGQASVTPVCSSENGPTNVCQQILTEDTLVVPVKVRMIQEPAERVLIGE